MNFALPSVIRQFWHDRSASALHRATNLSLLGECLAVGDAYAPDLPERLAAATVDWQGLSWLAGSCLVTPSLAGALQRKGLFDRLPEEVQDYLHTLQSLNRERNQTLREQLVIITEALNRIGIQPVLLKGAITLTSGQYPGAEDRVIGDLDLLVPDQHMEAATAALICLGYRVDDKDSQWVLPSHYQQYHHHGCPLLHPALPVKVELHRRIQFHQGDDARLRQQLITVPFSFDEGSMVLIPDVATRLLHNMLHCQISDGQRLKKVLNLRQLLEFAALAQHEATSFDTNRLLNRLRPQRQAILAEYWAQAEHWLKTPYPDTLARSRYQARQLWLLEWVATQPGWHRLFTCFDLLSRLPGRLPNLFIKLWVMPGYFPVKIREVLKGLSF
ncbi:MAG: nucleotidyltransferase family protein [Methylococcaceae bacterium]